MSRPSYLDDVKFKRNRFGDYISGDVAILSPRFTGKWIVAVRGELVRQCDTLTEAKRIAEGKAI